MLKHTTAYKIAKEAKVGDTVKCPVCGKSFIKRTYHQAFCSNARTKPVLNCKDKYWNTIDPNKRNNTTRISPASELYMEMKAQDSADRLENELNQDGSWDAHQCVTERCEYCGFINCQCD